MSNKITAYNHIFDQRIQRLVKQIKELRKNKGDKDLIKSCLKEAKTLRSKMKKIEKKKKQSNTHYITLNITDSSKILDHSKNIHVSSISNIGDELIIRFILNEE